MCDIVFCDSGIKHSQSGYIKAIDIGLGIYDENGHGSSLIELVHHINKELEIISIKILNEKKEGTLEGLLRALDKCIEIGPRVICLALSIESSTIENFNLKEKIQELYDKGIIVVAALHNGAEYSIPAVYSNVIGVRVCNIYPYCSKFFDSKKEIQCTLPLELFFAESLNEEFDKLQGNSVGCAFFSEHVARMLREKNGQALNLEELFERQVVDDINYYRYFEYLSACSDKQNDIIQVIHEVNVICEINNKDDRILPSLYDISKIRQYLKELKKKKLIINQRTFLRKSDLETVQSLASYFLIQDNVL